MYAEQTEGWKKQQGNQWRGTRTSFKELIVSGRNYSQLLKHEFALLVLTWKDEMISTNRDQDPQL